MSMPLISLLPVLLIMTNYQVFGYRDGADPSVCDTMIPSHGAKPQTGQNPYKVSINKNSVSALDTVNITLASVSRNSGEFRGFLIQVRKPGGNETVGRFAGNTENSRTIDCFGIKKSAMTHSSASPKSSTTVQWIAPNNVGDSEYQIYYSVVKEYSTYWTRVAHPETISVTTRRPTQTEILITSTTTEPPTVTKRFPSQDILQKWREVYQGCGRNKGCFGVPSNCIRKYNFQSNNPVTCDMMVTWTINTRGYIDFDLTGRPLNMTLDHHERGYVAVGFYKEHMEESSIIGCAYKNGTGNTPTIQRYFNPRNPLSNPDPQFGLTQFEASIVDGNIFCSFAQPSGTIPDLGLNFEFENYFLSLSKGSGVADGGLSRHPATEEKGHTPQAIYLTQDRTVIGANSRRRPGALFYS